MKLISSLLALSMTFCSFTSANSSFTLVKEGKPQAVILLSETPSQVAQDSATELNYWVERISGQTLPILTAEQWDGQTPWIAIGENRLTREAGWQTNDLGLEGARVIIRDQSIALLGNPPQPETDGRNGIENAVLEFVRHALRVSWIWPGPLGEVYEPSKTIQVPIRQWTWHPDIPWMRKLRASNNPASERIRLENLDLPFDPALTPLIEERHQYIQQWLKRQRMTDSALVNFGERHLPLNFGHSFQDWWQRFGEQHPDWFAKPPAGVTQMGGRGVKLNLSNPEVHQQIFSDWLRNHQQNPNSASSKFIRVGPNDSRGFDTRKETRSWDPPENKHFTNQQIWNGSAPVLTDRYVRFWNTILDKIHQVDPEVYATTYAYRNYREPPLVEKVNERIVIGYVGGEGYYPEEPWITEEWKGWTEKGAKLKIWRPNLLHAGHGIPWLYSKQLFNDFRSLQENGMMGTDFDSLTSNWAAQGFNYYIVSELHYRSEVSYETLANEYFGAFGPAADTIREYHEYFEELTRRGPDLMRTHGLVSRETWGGWWEAHIRLIPLLITEEVLTQSYQFLQTAMEKVEGSRPIYEQRVAWLLKSLDHQALMSRTFRKLQLHDPTIRQDFVTQREQLAPLWNLRQQLIGELILPAAGLLSQEQRQLGIWEAFTGEQGAPVETQTHPLNDGWKVLADPDNRGLDDKWYANLPSGDQWLSARVGTRWDALFKEHGDALPPEVAWYTLQFEVPALSDVHNRVRLYFESVDAEVHIWLNGWLVAERAWPHMGNYDSWKEPFMVDISNALQEGPDNQLVLRIRSENRNGGITGKVMLITGD